MLIHSPLEQFEILPLYLIQSDYFDVSFNNSSLILFVFCLSLILLYKSILQPSTYVPNPWQVGSESLYEASYGVVTEAAGPKGSPFFPLILTFFTLLLGVNCIGLIPYSFTATSHAIVTITLALGIWVGKLLVGVRLHKASLVTAFLPSGVPFALAPMLVAIEFLGFLIVAVSLPVRLFANMMAGHILLKVVAGFAWTMMTASGFLYLSHFVPLLVLFLLMGLETGVAVIQSYVFTVLTSLYIGDMVNNAH